MMKNFFFLLAFFLIVSCEKIQEGSCKVYEILQGNHYSESVSSELILQKCDSKIEFSFVVNQSMFYDPEVQGFKNGHNKIRGIVCNSALNIPEYSARITWRCFSLSNLDIGFIVHLPTMEGPVLGFLLKNVNVDDEIYCLIEDKNKEGFYFYVENLTHGEVSDTLISKHGAGNVKSHKFIDSPYFGGDGRASHDIYIKICTIKI